MPLGKHAAGGGATAQPIPTQRVDGGVTADALLMQIQADLIGIAVVVAAIQEATALGAAYLAGLQAGVWRSAADVGAYW